MKSKITIIVVLLVVAAIFVGPRILRPHLDKTMVQEAGEAVGAGLIEDLFRARLPAGYAAYCEKHHGPFPELMKAAQDYNARNRVRMLALIHDIEQSGGLTKSQKAAIDRQAFARVRAGIAGAKDPVARCRALVTDVDSGRYDL